MRIPIALLPCLLLLNSCNSPTMITIGNCNHAANGGSTSEPNGSQPVPCTVTLSAQGSGIVQAVKKATLANAAGQTVGAAALAEIGDGVTIATDLHGLPPGKYSMSLHSVANCDLVQSSNRTKQLSIEIDGSKDFGTIVKNASLGATNGLLGTDGGTIVISDNAGNRVACGVAN